MPLASVCGSPATWSMVDTRADGTPARCSRSQHVGGGERARDRARAPPQGRAVLDAARVVHEARSRASSGTPRAPVALTKSASEAAAIITQPSATGKAS